MNLFPLCAYNFKVLGKFRSEEMVAYPTWQSDDWIISARVNFTDRGTVSIWVKINSKKSFIRSAFSRDFVPCPFISPKWFWDIKIVFDLDKLFWSGSNNFGQVKIRLLWTGMDYVFVMIWICSKWFGTNKNDLDTSKTNDWYSTKMI